MAIRIDRIKVNRGGPLLQDFVLEPGDLNLVYGRNETGKTYVVESIIRFLFKTGSRAKAGWSMRDWDPAGRVVVSGLEGDRTSAFTKTGKKMEDYWGDDIGLPNDFSRLLVVKAGETKLVGGEKDGVGRDILRDYLSGVGILDTIAGKISATLRRKATVQGRRIEGDQKGEVQKWNQLRDDLDRLDILLEDIEGGYSSGIAYALRQEMKRIEEDLAAMKRAKCHQAYQLHRGIQDLNKDRESLPDDEELVELETAIGACELKKTELENKSGSLDDLEGIHDDYRWVENALTVYQDIMKGPAVSRPGLLFLVLAIAFLVGGVIAGLLGWEIPLVICGVGSAAFLLLYTRRMKVALGGVVDNMELENLKGDYESRFGSELAGIATIQAKVEELRDKRSRAKTLEEDLDRLALEIEPLETKIIEEITSIAGSTLPPQEWRNAIREIKKRRKELERKIQSKREQLASLAIEESEYLEDDPGVEWDLIQYDDLGKELGEKGEGLRAELEKLEQLKIRIRQETGSRSTDWEELVTALRGNREGTAAKYRQLVAEILAKVQVNTVIEEFRDQENTRIEDGLSREELTDPLHDLTGRYSTVRYEEKSGLVLVTEEDEEFPLADISTGAREQVFLALRMGFASLAMEDRSAFLILDDAFQHSDWLRRESLVTQTLELADTGWQIFYFTMDDHLRDLFISAGERFGGEFKSLEL